MKTKDIITPLELYAPINLQESYDNSGLLIGDPDHEVEKVLIALDVTDEVLAEAVEKKCNLIVTHHPLIFNDLKRLNGKNYVEKLVIKAIQNKLGIYAIHTNLDNVHNGVNAMLAKKLGLTNTEVLLAKGNNLQKLITFCPSEHAQSVRDEMFKAGAGHIGNYDSCSYNIAGEGTFRALEGADPFVGKQGEVHFEKETRIETIVPEYLTESVVKAMVKAHPYEEVAYDIYPLCNENKKTGSGMIGDLNPSMSPRDFLNQVKKQLGCKIVKCNSFIDRKISKVAICGGSGSFLIHKAYKAKADIFITGDVKYHDYFNYNGEMMIADAGHYETEQFTKELMQNILMEKFPNFALLISQVNTNPVITF